MTVSDVMPRVEKGAAWLDAHKPGWFDGINTTTLNLSSCERCVLGQLFNGYTSNASPAMERFVFNWGGERDLIVNHRHEWAAAHGFHCTTSGVQFEVSADGMISYTLSGSPEWGWLREAWITAILERQFAAQQPEPQLVSVEA